MGISEYILKLFETWEKVFILNGKNEQIKDSFDNLMRHRLDISMRHNEFKNSMQEGEVVDKYNALKDTGDVFQLLTINSILPFLEISLPEDAENPALSNLSSEEKLSHDYLFSIQEYEKVQSLMSDRFSKTISNFKTSHSDSSLTCQPAHCLEIIFGTTFKTYKEFSEVTFKIDDLGKEAFGKVAGFVMMKGNRRLFKDFTQ